MKRIVGLTVLMLALAFESTACLCARHIEFEHAAAGALVVRGVVTEYVYAHRRGIPIAMKVEVREVLRGQYRAGTITVIGDFGASCIPYVSNFPVGTEWVMAVRGPSEVDGLGDENYAPPGCAAAFLRVKDGSVVLARQGVRAELSLSELRSLIESR